MTELSLPPPRDLPPGHLDQRAAHLYSEITRERPRRTRRISVLAIAAACVLLAAALSFALIPKSGNTPRGVGADGPVGGVRLVPETDVVGATFTVFAELNVPKGYGDGTGWISVRRFEGQPGTNPTTLRSDVAFDESKVVYQEHVPGAVIAGNPSDGYLWKWSGSLSPSDWAGGCAIGSFYMVVALSGDPTGYSEAGWTRWFTCQPGATSSYGPTGAVGPTGAG